MKFSMNGFRRQLSGSCNQLKDIAQRILNDDFYDDEDLVEAVNEIITHSNVLNCVYLDSDENFTDMSGIEVEHIELSRSQSHEL
jgi:hypothetical protein